MSYTDLIATLSVGVGLGTLIVTVLVLKWTAQWSARWQLVCIVVPNLARGTQAGGFSQLVLVFENVGGSTAPAAHAWFTGLPGSSGKFLEPATGSRSVPVGDTLTVQWSFEQLPKMPDWAPRKPYTQGDDVYFALDGLEVSIHWGPGGKKKQLITDLHHKQGDVPYLDWNNAPESVRRRLPYLEPRLE